MKKVADLFKSLIIRLKESLEQHWKIATGNQATTEQETRAERFNKFITAHTQDGHLLVLKIISCFLILFILWACFFKINETIKATGEVIPSKFVQKLGVLEGGTIKDIMVKEGQLVKANQILFRIDPTDHQSKLNEFERNYYRNLATIERLKAHIKGTPFNPSETLKTMFPEFVKQEEENYANDKLRLEKEKASIIEEVSSKTQALKQAEERLKHADKQLPILQEQVNITSDLYKKGLYSRLRSLDIERQKVDTEKEIGTLKEQIPGLNADIKQAQAKLAKIDTDYIAQYQRELKDSQTKLDEAKSNKEIFAEKIRRDEIRAPIDGIVKDINYKTIGGVVKAGDDILTVVPLDDELLIEAKVAPSDIGFVRPGQKVSIKITTYDYTIFGRLEGVVEKVSPDANQDKQERSFFKVTIRSSHNYLEKDGQRHGLGVGMGAELDIEIGRHSVMTFILKPILRGFQGSLTER